MSPSTVFWEILTLKDFHEQITTAINLSIRYQHSENTDKYESKVQLGSCLEIMNFSEE